MTLVHMHKRGNHRLKLLYPSAILIVDDRTGLKSQDTSEGPVQLPALGFSLENLPITALNICHVFLPRQLRVVQVVEWNIGIPFHELVFPSQKHAARGNHNRTTHREELHKCLEKHHTEACFPSPGSMWFLVFVFKSELQGQWWSIHFGTLESFIQIALLLQYSVKKDVLHIETSCSLLPLLNYGCLGVEDDLRRETIPFLFSPASAAFPFPSALLRTEEGTVKLTSPSSESSSSDEDDDDDDSKSSKSEESVLERLTEESTLLFEVDEATSS
nr:hypothetical protein Iba_scaffold3550CG0040 [Ipomoea batatas]